MIVRIAKILLKFVLGFLGVTFFYVIIALISGFFTFEAKATEDSQKTIDVFLQTNGVHSELILPVVNTEFDWRTIIDPNHCTSADKNFSYVAIGWGNRKFYLETPQWSDLKFTTAIQAASGFNETAIHVNFYKNRSSNDTCKKIRITNAQYQKMVSFFIDQFKLENGKAKLIATNIRYNAYDAFYEANGSYSIFKTCNTFTNEALYASDLKSCLWTPFDFHILRLYP